ncbi:MAG: hypothetical protein STSR0006_15430 [Lentimicrobium sp.]
MTVISIKQSGMLWVKKFNLIVGKLFEKEVSMCPDKKDKMLYCISNTILDILYGAQKKRGRSKDASRML